jgi:ATP-dependent Clp protease ATP-binding subunit ClpC
MSVYMFRAATRDVLDLSRAAAVKLKHEYIGTEHILFGLLESKAQPLDAIIRRVGIDRAAIASQLESTIRRGKGTTAAPRDLPFTSRAKHVLEHAMISARDMGTTEIGPEHLLVGLCAEERCIAAQVLTDAGVTIQSVRNALNAITEEES